MGERVLICRAQRQWRGRGGLWKGRVQALEEQTQKRLQALESKLGERLAALEQAQQKMAALESRTARLAAVDRVAGKGTAASA